MYIYTLGFISALAIYHLLIYLGRRKDYSNLSYSIFCISFALALFLREEFPLNSIIINSFFIICVHFVAGSIAIFAISIFKIKRLINQKLLNKFYLLLSFYLLVVIITAVLTGSHSLLFPLYLPAVSAFAVFCLISLVYTFIKDKLYLDRLKLSVAFGFISVVVMCTVSAIMHSFNITPPFFIVSLVFLANSVIFANSLAVYVNREHKELEQLNDNLEKKVKERTRQLEDAKIEIEEQARQKTTFFINLAHETKTPLTLINNYLASFIKKHGESEELLIIKRNIRKLTDDMINFMDSEKLRLSQVFYDHNQICALSSILSNKTVLFNETALQNNIDLKWNVEKEFYTKADPAAIDRIFNNLLDNAVKYTESNGRVAVTLTGEGDRVKLTVSDTGIGIPEEEMEHIFSPFHQLSHEKSNIQGLGMGLYITSRIIQELNGTIGVKSELHKGSEFTVYLKRYDKQNGDTVAIAENLTEPAGQAPVSVEELTLKEHDPEKKSILIVEDNLQLVANLKKAMEETYNIYFAVNGSRALERLESGPVPDIIISDIMMDVMDGYRFRERLMENPGYKALPFIFLSARTDPGERLRGLCRGAVDYICKPFDMAELQEKIKNWLMLIELNSSGATPGSKHQRRLKCFFQEFNINNREQDVLFFLLRGYQNKTIAGKMNITAHTVKKHIERIKIKLGVTHKDELLDCLFDYVYK